MDREQCFLIYTTFCGDVERTAHALGIRPIDVLRVADDEHWMDKIKPIIELKQSSRPGDFERGVNRALNFVQAHKFRLFLERIMKKIGGFNDEEINDYLFHVGQADDKSAVKKLSCRAMADLASAIEKCHAMSYLALNDTVQDRTRRKEQTDDNASAGDLHAKIALAMAEAGATTTPRAKLLDVQLAVVAETAKPEKLTPYDKG